MKSFHFTQWRGSVPRDMGSSPVVDTNFAAAALASEMTKGVEHPATEEEEDRAEDEAQHCPEGWVCQEIERDLKKCPKEMTALSIRVNAHWVFSLLDLNKVFTNVQGIKRIHVTPICLSGLCDTESIGAFHWKNNCQHSNIINSGIWAKVDQTERAGDCWGREDASENQLERIQLSD